MAPNSTPPLRSAPCTACKRFLQLVEPGAAGFDVPVVTINDQPRFPWRGIMFDVGRHFIPLDVLRRNVDGMEAVKMNVFHWHLSENQGFRIESKKFPKLHELGSDDLYLHARRSPRLHRLRARARHSRRSGIRHARPQHSLVRRLSRTRQRPRPLPDRTQVGRDGSGHGSHERKNLQTPRRLHRRNGQSFSPTISSTSAATK